MAAGMHTVPVMASETQAEIQSVSQSKEGRIVKGFVQDKNNEPIVGCTILIPGTNVGVSSDLDGKFEINLPEGQTKLVFSYIGFSTVEVDVKGKNTVDVTMFQDVVNLQDVVVVGYNLVKRSQITGSISEVKSDKINKQASASLEDRLQGKTAGLLITSGSGQPGSNDISIRIRGTGSINGSNTPLYILDGISVEPAQFAALNNDDIADIQVLKDASATAIYGSRGANGVIVIKTKSGKEGKTNISYNMKLGLAMLRDPKTEMMNGAENIQYQKYCLEANPNARNFPLMQLMYLEQKAASGSLTPDEAMMWNSGKARLARARKTDTDWIDLMTQNGITKDHSLSISGGTEKTKFYISGSYIDQEGSLKGSELKRYNTRINLDHRINDFVDFGVTSTMGYSKSHSSDPGTGANRFNWSNPWFTSLLAYPYEDPDQWYNGDNPTLITKYFTRKTNNLRLVGSGFLNLRFTDWLKFRSNFGVDYYNNRNMSALERNHPKAVADKGNLSQGTSVMRRYTWTNTLNFNHTFADKHMVSGVAGFELFDGIFESFSQTGHDLDQFMTDTPAGIGDKTGSSDNPPSIGGGKTHSNLLSVFSQATYTYDNRYHLSASLRYDESSKFQGSNKGAIFWSLGGAWDMRSEDFMSGAEKIDLLKLRLSYGTNGNQGGIGDFDYETGYGKTSYNGVPGYVRVKMGNPHLKWETSRQFDLGVDVRSFNSRLNGSIDFYHKKTQDLLMFKKISQLSGSGQIQTNAGSVINTGVEFTLNAVPVRTKDFEWTIGGNITYNKNKIDDLGTWANEDNKFVNGDNIYEVGKPLGTWYMVESAGVNPETGEAWFYDQQGGKTEDINVAPRVDKFKSYEIPWFGGFNTQLSYKGFELSANFNFAFNYYIMNTSKWFVDNHAFNGNKPKYMLTMWREPGQQTKVPRFDAKNNPSPWASQFLQDASYLKLKTLRLAYTPNRKILDKIRFVKSMTMFLQGENLITWTDYQGMDPEVNGSHDTMIYPIPRTFIFGLNINF